jgi:hypothetical protein
MSPLNTRIVSNNVKESEENIYSDQSYWFLHYSLKGRKGGGVMRVE